MSAFDNIDWNAISDVIRFPEHALWQSEQRHKGQGAASTPASTAPSEASAAGVPAEPSASIATNVPIGRSAPSKSTAVHKPDPVAALSAALDAAASDEERSALSAAAPRKVRESLNARLTYRKSITDIDTRYAAFTAQLEAAADDSARLALIAAAQRDPKRGAAFLSEWTWRRTATENESRRRYLALIGGATSGE